MSHEGPYHYEAKLGRGVGRPLHHFAQLASIVVPPYHVAHNLKLLFLKNNNGASDFLVKFYLNFAQKNYTVILFYLYVLEISLVIRIMHLSSKILFDITFLSTCNRNKKTQMLTSILSFQDFGLSHHV